MTEKSSKINSIIKEIKNQEKNSKSIEEKYYVNF